MKHKIHRRDLLRSAALAALILPIARSTMARAAEPKARRFVTLFTPNGAQYGDALPSGGETNFDFGDFYRPLERHRADTIALTKLHMGGVPYGENHEYGHYSGSVGCLTCTTEERIDPTTGDGTGELLGKAAGPSIDQFIAQALFDARLAPSRRAPVYGISSSRFPEGYPVYHESAGKLAPIETDPQAAYQAMFDGVASSTGEDISLLIARRKSVLDAAWGDCQSYLPALPTEGRVLLDYHCTRIRELEQSLQVGLVCDPAATGFASVAGLSPEDPNNYPALTDFFFRLMTVAFQCDLTRVASFAFGGSGASRVNMPWLDAPLIAEVDTGERNVRDHHSHTHAGTRETCTLFMQWYASKMAEFLDGLTRRQPNGSRLLDDTVVLYTPEFGGAMSPHGNAEVPMLVFGSGGQFRTGRHLQFDNDAKHTHALMVSLIQSVGLTGVDQFGLKGGGRGTLGRLYA